MGLQTLKNDGCPEEILGRVPSEFKSRLMSVLRQPFDQSEYDDLMAMATRRIRITKFKELRNMSIPYSTNALGYSYFDHYPGKFS